MDIQKIKETVMKKDFYKRILVILFGVFLLALTYNMFLDALWQEGVQLMDKHALAVNINRLRKKIEDENHSYITNVYGMGYIWK